MRNFAFRAIRFGLKELFALVALTTVAIWLGFSYWKLHIAQRNFDESWASFQAETATYEQVYSASLLLRTAKCGVPFADRHAAGKEHLALTAQWEFSHAHACRMGDTQERYHIDADMLHHWRVKAQQWLAAQ